ncbi:hypothetical protein [Sulfurimonas sp. HSL3-7]|uniref:hypothetical protein n=1 Tax=Sulfonitrofixus jiaomeiensis TaxID=3131938 RepID=UPI0031F9BCE2
MKQLFLIALAGGLLLLSGCTKHETKQNLHNVNEGLKSTWKKTKKSFSETTEEFKEKTK